MRILLRFIFCCFVVLVFIENMLKKGLAKIVLFFKKPKRRRGRMPLSVKFSRAKVWYILLGIFVSFFFLFLPLVFVVFLQDLPTPEQLVFRQIPQTTKIYDRHNILLAEIYTQQNRTMIPLADVPKSLQEATLAIEDKHFYEHPGVDFISLIRALKETIINNNPQGGSTITQQLIKSSLLTPERSITRKVKEVVLAFWAERIYTKEQILEMYFNQVPYGGTAYGVEAAAETYFNKSVRQLTLAESSFLAGLTAAPSVYSPYGLTPTAWKTRQREVLHNMVKLKYISQKQADAAAKEPLFFREQQQSLHAPHFVEYVKQQLIQTYGITAVEKGGLQIITTLDLPTEEMAEKIVRDEVERSRYLSVSNGAALITDPRKGDILAMVGSHDFNDPESGNVNIATSRRQPGSSIKVVTYSAALQHGMTPATMLDDTPVSYPLTDGQVYSPVNYDGNYRGRIPLRDALANSLNIPAIKTLDAIGIPTMVALAKDMGVTSWGDPKDYGLSLTLGAAEVTMMDMARVNGVLAHQGVIIPLNPIIKVTDSTGKTLEQKTTPAGKKVLDPSITFLISNILADNAARTPTFGNNSDLKIEGHTVSVKTGTTDNKRDNWTNGYTNNFVVIAWVGNNDNTPMSQNLASGITGAAPIWHDIMTNLLAKNPETQPTIPETIVQKRCNGREEYFVKGTETTANCDVINPSSRFSDRKESRQRNPRRRQTDTPE